MLSLLFMNWLFFANQKKKKHAIKFILVHLYIHKRADLYTNVFAYLLSDVILILIPINLEFSITIAEWSETLLHFKNSL